MKLGLTVLRATLGAVFVSHGAQKLFGWFGGPGLDAMGQGFEQMGLRPGRRNALIAGGSEFGGGLMLATGFLTPLGAAAVIAVMGEATRLVHWEKGFFNTDGGFEYNALLAAAALTLADTGPGEWSLDERLGLKLKGPLWALVALGGGVAGPRLIDRLGPPSDTPPATGPETMPEPVQATSA